MPTLTTCALCGDETEETGDEAEICALHRNLLGQGYVAFIAYPGNAALVKRDLLEPLGFEFNDDVFAVHCTPAVVLQMQGLAVSFAAAKHKVH